MADSLPLFARLQSNGPIADIGGIEPPSSQVMMPTPRSIRRRSPAGQNVATTIANGAAVVSINACAQPRSQHDKGKVRPDATSNDPYCVGGKPYLDAEKIPGNDPVPLKDGTSQPVIGHDGKPVYGPSRGINAMDAIAGDVDSAQSQRERLFEKLPEFGQGRSRDFQRIRDDDGSIIFTKKYTEFSDVTIGYADAKRGGGIPSTELAANSYAMFKSNFDPSEKKHWWYDSLPERLVYDYRLGRSLRISRRDGKAVAYP